MSLDRARRLHPTGLGLWGFAEMSSDSTQASGHSVLEFPKALDGKRQGRLDLTCNQALSGETSSGFPYPRHPGNAALHTPAPLKAEEELWL
ncbi:hypothetical protein P7K49_004217, partial [Saguinus oedipus]